MLSVNGDQEKVSKAIVFHSPICFFFYQNKLCQVLAFVLFIYLIVWANRKIVIKAVLEFIEMVAAEVNMKPFWVDSLKDVYTNSQNTITVLIDANNIEG